MPLISNIGIQYSVLKLQHEYLQRVPEKLSLFRTGHANGSFLTTNNRSLLTREEGGGGSLILKITLYTSPALTKYTNMSLEQLAIALQN